MVAGLVYLTGIAIILLIKPQFMFRDDGRWKEFGIGRDPANFTHFPFWLFTVVWAVLAYVVVIFLEDAFYIPDGDKNLTVNSSTMNSRKNMGRNNLSKANTVQELVPGYYMLNEGGTARNGVPRYVYIGPEEP